MPPDDSVITRRDCSSLSSPADSCNERRVLDVWWLRCVTTLDTGQECDPTIIHLDLSVRLSGHGTQKLSLRFT